MNKQRLEIATAVLAGFAANPEWVANFNVADPKDINFAAQAAVMAADKLLSVLSMDKESALSKALELSLIMLIHSEPGDSRGVSDEFVAMAGVLSGSGNREEGLKIINTAIERHHALAQLRKNP